MDHVTATSPNWVVESESPSSEKTVEVEHGGQPVEIKEQPRPEQHVSDDSSATEQVIDKDDKEILNEAEAGCAGNMESTADHLSNEGTEVSVERNLFVTDDGGEDIGNESSTSEAHQDTEKIEQEKIPRVEILMVGDVASSAKENKKTEDESSEESLLKVKTGDENNEKMCTDQLDEKMIDHKEVSKEKMHLVEEPSTETQSDNQETDIKSVENIIAKEKVSSDDGRTSTEQQEVHMVEQEEIQKCETNLNDNTMTANKQTDHQEVEEKLKADCIVKEYGNDGNDGRLSTTQHDVLVVEQAENFVQEIPITESAPLAEDQTNYEEEIESIEHKLSELSFQETKQRTDDALPTQTYSVESKEAVSEQESESQKDASFSETRLDEDHEIVRNIAMKDDSQPAELMEVALEVDKVSDVQPERDPKDPFPEIEIATVQDPIATESEKDTVIAPPVNSNIDTDEHISQSVEAFETRQEENADELPNCELAQSCNPVEEAIYSEIVAPNGTEISTVDPVIEIASSTPPSLLNIASTSPSAKVNSTPPGDMLHHIKNIQFKDKNVGIVTQNENGPCPLVAIINVLLLRRQITLPAHSEIVAAAKLMEYIGDSMLESVPKNLSGEVRLNYEQNMHDAMAVLPKLQTGLDVNVKFTGVRDFEYTPECIIFDLLRIPLFHGWLVDPQTPEVVVAVGQAGYNQLVEKVISQKCSSDENAVHEALVIENFLERSASQLTYHGLSELTTSMEDDEIGVLFRNNHFSTIYKRQKELLQLVTDQGFLGESSVVWETLGSIDGDGQFVDSHFRTVPPKPELATSGDSTSPNTSAQLTAEQQIDHDFLVALSLQEEQQQEQPTVVQEEDTGDVGEDVAKTLAENERSSQELRDLELARQLQEEERHAAEVETETVDRETAGASSQQPPATRIGSPLPHSTKKKDCTIL